MRRGPGDDWPGRSGPHWTPPSQTTGAGAGIPARLIEVGTPFTSSAGLAFSVVDHVGRVRQRSDLGQPAVLTATVALRRGFTVYDHLGDLPVVVLALLALAAGWHRQRRSRRYS